jgi:hypothetical protein
MGIEMRNQQNFANAWPWMIPEIRKHHNLQQLITTSLWHSIFYNNIQECLPRTTIPKPTGSSLGKEWANRLIGVSLS